MFDQRFLDELIARSDIVDVVSAYVALQRKGGNLFGLCPFHNEKTPSFSVSPDKQIYHCFGCKKGGGVINFIMEIENLTFPEAVRFLAKRANLPVPEDDGPQDGADRLRRRVLELNRDAARWYYDLLCSPEGAAVLGYDLFELDGETVTEVTFSENGQAWRYRMMPTMDVTEHIPDISGYTGGGKTAEGQVRWCAARLCWDEDGTGCIIWKDVAPGLAYSLTVDSGATETLLNDMAQRVFQPAQGEDE